MQTNTIVPLLVLITGLPEGTGGGPQGPRPEVPEGPIYVQKHGNPVQYRNIWIVER